MASGFVNMMIALNIIISLDIEIREAFRASRIDCTAVN